MVENRIIELKKDLSKTEFDLEQVLQKHVIDINSFLFDNSNSDLEYRIRNIIAKSLGVHLNEVVIVGSAKIGYSLSPKKLYHQLDSKYHQTKRKKDKSDIDIAVISPSLFENLKKIMYDFTDGLKLDWDSNEYYSDPSKFNIPINYLFYQYSYKGWFRPDFRPRGFEICKNGSFEELKREIYQLTKRKLGLGIYQDWHFFKSYHLKNLELLRMQSKTDLI